MIKSNKLRNVHISILIAGAKQKDTAGLNVTTPWVSCGFNFTK